jgi:hypothetical protein
MKVASERGYGCSLTHQSVQIGKALSVEESHLSQRSGDETAHGADVFTIREGKRYECRRTRPPHGSDRASVRERTRERHQRLGGLLLREARSLYRLCLSIDCRTPAPHFRI